MAILAIEIPDSPFEFELGDKVIVTGTHEQGEVIGRAEYKRGEPTYHVDYLRPDGIEARAWFGASALVNAEF